MILEHDKIYKTSFGGKVSMLNNGDGSFPFLGTLKFIDLAVYESGFISTKPISYTNNGVSNRKCRDFDIVSEWKEGDTIGSYEQKETSFENSEIQKQIINGHYKGRENTLFEIFNTILSHRRSTFWSAALQCLKNKFPQL